MVSKEEFFKKHMEMWGKTAVDNTFRKKMKEDPRGAISEFFGEKPADSFTIKVVEPDPAYSMTFMLPPFKDELSEDEIGSVAGGVWMGMDPNAIKNLMSRGGLLGSSSSSWNSPNKLHVMPNNFRHT